MSIGKEATLQVSISDQEFDIVLLTCIDARFKYLAGLGDLSNFNLIIDITEMLAERRDVYAFRPEFNDRLEEVIFIDKQPDLQEFLSANIVKRVIIFSPPTNIEKLEPLVNLIKEHGAQCDMAINKNALATLIPFPQARAAWKRVRSASFRKRTLDIDNLYYSDSAFLPQWAPIVRPRELVKVKHVDAPRYVNKEAEYNLLLDSSFPFHKEFKRYNHPLDPDVFYKRIREFSEIVNEETKMAKFIVALHPNSDLQEVAYLGDLGWCINASNEVISRANKVWSFGSDASGTAVAYRKEVEYLNFPDLLPEKIQKYIFKKSKNFGVPVIEYDGKTANRKDMSSINRRFRQRIYRRTYAIGAPFLSEVIPGNTA